MLKNIGNTELVLILVILILLFGSKRLSGLAKGLGEVIKEFKKALGDDRDDTTKT